MYLCNHIIVHIFGISLVFPSIVLGFVKNRFSRETNLPAPTLGKLRLFSSSNASDITISWHPVKSSHEPILGYKVRLWEQESKTAILSMKTDDGVEWIDNIEDVRKPMSPKGKLLEYRMTGAEHSEITIHGLKKATPYLIEVLAYSANGDGPPSPGNVIEIQSGTINNKQMDPASTVNSTGSMVAASSLT